MSKTVTVKLSEPITYGEGEKAVTYSEFTFRSARLKDVIASEIVSGETGRIAAVLASMAGVPYQAFREIEMVDMNTILEKTGHLLGNAPPSAETGG